VAEQRYLAVLAVIEDGLSVTEAAATEIFGDAVAVTAMVERLVHHAEIINLKATATRSKTAARRSPANDQTVQISTAANRPGSAAVDNRRLHRNRVKHGAAALCSSEATDGC
jgi:hypothetical protein